MLRFSVDFLENLRKDLPKIRRVFPTSSVKHFLRVSVGFHQLKLRPFVTSPFPRVAGIRGIFRTLRTTCTSTCRPKFRPAIVFFAKSYSNFFERDSSPSESTYLRSVRLIRSHHHFRPCWNLRQALHRTDCAAIEYDFVGALPCGYDYFNGSPRSGRPPTSLPNRLWGEKGWTATSRSTA
jgi:hypothetical protein